MDLILPNTSTAPSLDTLLTQGLIEPLDGAGRSGYKLYPTTAEETAQLLHWAEQSDRPVAMYPMAAAFLPEPLWLDYSKLRQVRHYSPADFVIQVECGLTVRELAAILAPNQQAFALSYPPNLTLGEILAEERPALETGLKGYPRDYVLKTEIATPDGQLTISGADVVKNVTGYDLAKLYVGGWHALGVLTSVTLKLTALPPARKHWLFPFDSLHSAAAFCKQVLAQKLPFSVCELAQHNEQWHLLIELSGADTVLDEAQIALHAFAETEQSPLDTRSGLELLHTLQQWPTETTVIEVALPLGNWQAFASQIARQGSLGNIRLQIRPAAGLVYISAPLFPFAALRHLHKEASEHEGLLQILTISSRDAGNASSALAIFEEFNLPENPVLRTLLKNLKKSYDPKGILFTPRLPL